MSEEQLQIDIKLVTAAVHNYKMPISDQLAAAAAWQRLKGHLTSKPDIERDLILYGESFELNGARISPNNVIDHRSHTKEAVCTCPSGDGSLRWPCPQHPPAKTLENSSETVWREGWAYAYSGFAKLYIDDGELQDNSTVPFIDWRRDSAETIRNKIIERAKIALGYGHE